MSVDGGQAGVILGGATALLVLGGAIFKAANLRGDANNKWSSRVDLAAVALDEKTIAELRKLGDEIETVMPDQNRPFDPAQAIIDPSPLSERVERTAKYYRARVRMASDLNHVRQLGRLFVASLLLLAVGVTLLTVYYAELIGWGWMPWAGGGSGGLGLLVLVAGGVTYIVCVDRLSSAEILAETAAQAAGGGSA